MAVQLIETKKEPFMTTDIYENQRKRITTSKQLKLRPIGQKESFTVQPNMVIVIDNEKEQFPTGAVVFESFGGLEVPVYIPPFLIANAK